MNKTYLTLLFAGMLCCNTALARPHDNGMMPPPPPEHSEQDMEKHHEKMENKLADDLKLTDEQRAQAKEMRQEARKKIKPLMKEMKGIRQKMDKIRKENMEAFEKILTPEQKAQFDKIKAERKAQRPQKRPHDMPKMPPLPME